MKKYVLSLAIVSALLFVTTNIQAQSWADLFKKENIEKVVNAVTGNNAIDMTGTWTYSGSAIEFESDNLLQKAGGAAAASLAENKLNEQLAKVGIKRTGKLYFQCGQHFYKHRRKTHDERNVFL